MNLKRPPRKEHLFFPFGKSISDPLGHQCGFILDDLAIWILLFCFAISNLCQQTEEKNPQKQTSGTNVEAVFDRLKRKKISIYQYLCNCLSSQPINRTKLILRNQNIFSFEPYAVVIQRKGLSSAREETKLIVLHSRTKCIVTDKKVHTFIKGCA